MLTKFTLLKRRPDLSSAQFSQHWRTTHAKVLVEQGGHKTYNKRYVQNHFLHDSGLDLGSQAFDGAAQMAPQSANVITSGFQENPLYLKHVRPDEDRFLSVKDCVVLYCESHVVVRPPSSARYKLLSILKRKPASTHEQFMAGWRDKEAMLAQKLPHLWPLVRGVVQHEVLPDATRGMSAGERGDPAIAYDGVAEVLFDNLDDLRATVGLSEFCQVLSAADATLVGDDSHAFVAKEELIYDDA